jgi:RNA polymerase sigma factor (sigma-70 family)
MTDADILKLVSGEKFHPAIKQLYRYYPVVRKYVVNNSGSRQEAEDIFQDALIVLFNKVKAGNFELRAGLNTYLFGVCRLLWLEELRKKERTVRSEKLAAEDLGSTFTEKDLEEEQKAKQAQQAVEKLGAKCKQLLELFYFKKVSMKEIAQQLGFATEQVARNQKYRCIEKAKGFLKTN